MSLLLNAKISRLSNHKTACKLLTFINGVKVHYPNSDRHILGEPYLVKAPQFKNEHYIFVRSSVNNPRSFLFLQYLLIYKF